MYKLSLLIVLIISIIGQSQSSNYSGFINVDNVYNGSMFYWFFESQNNASSAPVVLYLTGGYASMALSLVFENGPFKVNADFSTTPNPYSWNTVANVIYVDSPLGAGFSTVDEGGYSKSETDTAARLYTFLQQFFTLYPQYKSNPFYVVGESLAGKTAPHIAYLIHNKNRAIPQPSIKINLKGIGILSGVVDPGLQYSSFPDKAFYSGMISKETFREAEDLAEECRDSIDSNDLTGQVNNCNGVLGVIGNAAANFNIYDVTKTCPLELAPVCYDLSLGAIYFMLPSTRAQLGLSVNATWNFLNPVVRENLAPVFFKSETDYIPKLLDAQYRVLVINGANDYIANIIGAEVWISKLKWSGRSDFNHGVRQPLYLGSQIAAYYQSTRGLTFMSVKNAGHFIDMDQPATSLEAFTKFFNNQL